MPGRIPENFVRSLLDRADITEYLGTELKLTKKGQDHWACCPFHQEKTPSFKVSSERQNYYCFGCKASGNIIGYIMDRNNLDFVAAIETLAAHYGLEVPREGGDFKRPDEDIYKMLTRATECFASWLKAKAGQPARDYLKERGVKPKSTSQFALGFAPPSWDSLLKKLGGSDEQRDLLLKAGLIRRSDSGTFYDMFRGRLMFPIRDLRGRVIGFGARALGDEQPKYLNSPETPVFLKARELYGLHEARQAERRIEMLVLVEGYTDVVTLHQAGITNAVATLGTAANEQHFETLFRYTDELVCCFDGDSAGRSAAQAAMLQAIPGLKTSKKLRFAFLPDGEDPDSLVSAHGADALRQRLSSSQVFSDYFFSAFEQGLNLHTMEDRATLSRLASPHIERLPKGTLKELMRAQLAEKVGAPSAPPVPSVTQHPATRSAQRPARRNKVQALRQRMLGILIKYPRFLANLDESLQQALSTERGDGLSALVAYLQKNHNAELAEVRGFFHNSEHGAAIQEAASAKFALDGDPLFNEFEVGARKIATHIARDEAKRALRERLRTTSSDGDASV